MINAEGQRWKEIRSLASPAFTTRNLKKMQVHEVDKGAGKIRKTSDKDKMMKLMDDSTDEFLEAIKVLRSKHESFEFRELCQRLTADVMIRSAFGLKSNLLKKDGTNSIAESLFQESLRTFQQFRQAWINFFTACFPEFSVMWRMIISYSSRNNKTATDKTFDEMTPIIQFRRENREKDRNDLLEMMLNAEVEDDSPINVHSLTASLDADNTSEETKTTERATDRTKKISLTNEEVLATVFCFFMAGFDTTGTTLAFMSYLLAKHQDVQGRLREEILSVLNKDGAFTYDNIYGLKYMDQVISESLRCYSPVTGFTTRRCARDYVYKGITIPAGTSIVIPNHHLSHDPNLWEEPEVFDPERFSPENKGLIDPIVYQPFGQGPRNCAGMRFAQLELKLTMSKLLSTYRLLLDDRHIKEKDLTIESSFILAYPKDGIWIKFEKL